MPSLCPIPSDVEIRRKNRELYDRTSDPIWRLVAYDPLHDGWEFINLGGFWLLEQIGRRVNLGPHSSVLELCCGQGAVCRYLEARYGCAVTGVDLNAEQIRTARASRDERGPTFASRCRFFQADAVDWSAAARYDLVLSLDSLMLIADAGRFLERACEALEPGGLLALSTLGAGDRLDERMRQFVWDVDGMVALPGVDELHGQLRAAGLHETRVDDITPVAVSASSTMHEATERAREAIIGAQGEAAYVGWRNTGIVYWRAFETGVLTYLLASGRRGASTVD